MIRVWRSEVRKLVRPRFIISNFLVAFALQIAITVTMFLKAKGSMVDDLSKASGLFYGTKTIASFLGIIIFCISAASFAQEYGNGTLKNLLVRHPNRTTLMLGKIIALATFAGALILSTAILSGLLSYALATKAHVHTSNWNFLGISFLSQLANVLLAAIAYGILGGTLAVILRSSITSISAGLVWFLVIETLLGFLSKEMSKWLPGGNLANFADGGAADLSYFHSAIVTAGYSTIALGGLLIIFNMRDVAN